MRKLFIAYGVALIIYLVVSAATAGTIKVDADTWQELLLEYTPTKDMEVKLDMFAYGGSTYNLIIDPYSLFWDRRFFEALPKQISAQERVITT